MIRIVLVSSLVMAAALTAAAPTSPPQAPPKLPPAVEKLPDGTFRVGQIHVDTAKREIAILGRANEVTFLEFVACTEGGMKAYESALTLGTDGVAFNTALLLIGLDPSHARVPKMHFDPIAPAGDPVEIWVEWGGTLSNGLPVLPPATGRPGGPPLPAGAPTPAVGPATKTRMRVEQLLFDKRTNQPLPEGPWVYTGSSFVAGGNPKDLPRYLADLDGVLIGFVHSPAPIIENPRAGAVNGFGSVVMNTQIGLLPGMPVLVTVKALDRSAREQR
jgi:hypothetical protein